MKTTDRLEIAAICLQGILAHSGSGTTQDSARENAEDALRSADALIELMKESHDA